MFVRYGLIALAVTQGPIGLWALVAPRSFYEDFPLGRGGWVSTLGPYDEHLVVDYGALTLALVTVLAAAAWWMDRRIAMLAAAAYLVWSVPHFVYHMITLDKYDATDAVGNLITLTFTVALPVAIWLKARSSLSVQFTSQPLEPSK